MTDVPPKRRRADTPPTTPDPIEIAMEAEASGQAPEGVAHRVLAKQERLIGWQIASERAGFALKVLTGLVGLAVAAWLGWLALDASRAAGIVMQPFDTTPALAERGFTGEAIAKELAGRVLAMQAATSSARAGRRTSAATESVSLVIPQTGVSVGELQRLLREALGHETRVSGALREAPGGGLTLSLRIDGRSVPVAAPAAETGGSAEAWLDRGAEAVMRESDAYRFSTWLDTVVHRREESMAVARELTQHGPASERAWAWSGIAARLRNSGDVAGAIAAARESVRLDPSRSTAWGNLSTSLLLLGHDGAAHAAAVRTEEETVRMRVPNFACGFRPEQYENDWLMAIRRCEASIAANATASGARSSLVIVAQARARLHEPRAAQAVLDSLTPPFDPLSGSPRTPIVVLAEQADWTRLEQLTSEPWRLAPGIGTGPALDRTLRTPWRAFALARLGRLPEAQALIGTTPGDCYVCVRMRGTIAALAGDAAGADRWFAEAVRQAPSLADAEQEWAQAKLARGDAAGALALFRAAAKKAPRWADPRKGEGDALARLGRPADALPAYAAAAERAPRWGRLHLDWGEALAKLSKADEARAKWRAAAGMDLTAAERARLDALLGRQAATSN